MNKSVMKISRLVSRYYVEMLIGLYAKSLFMEDFVSACKEACFRDVGRAYFRKLIKNLNQYSCHRSTFGSTNMG